MGQLDDKTAAIVGGASGIGLEIASSFFGEGAAIMLADIDGSKLQLAAQGLKSKDPKRVGAIEADVTRSSQVDRLVQETVRCFGKLDILVNCAGVLEQAPLHELSDETWDRGIKVMLYGVFYGIRAGVRQMLAQGGGGCIINISSVASLVPLTESAHYCVAKSGVNMLTKVAAARFGKQKIRVNAIAPGETWTPMTEELLRVEGVAEIFEEVTPLGRLGQPHDIAGAALFLASEKADWITGHLLVVDGGQSLREVKAEDLFRAG